MTPMTPVALSALALAVLAVAWTHAPDLAIKPRLRVLLTLTTLTITTTLIATIGALR